MTTLEEIRQSVENGHYKITEQVITQALKQHIPAIKILDEAMVPAMREMGERYKNNEEVFPEFYPLPAVCVKGWIFSLPAWNLSGDCMWAQ